MAKVNLRLRGGPYDSQTITLDVDDTDNPPDPYNVSMHGPHERMETYAYRRVGRESAGRISDTWVYEAQDVETGS